MSVEVTVTVAGVQVPLSFCIWIRCPLCRGGRSLALLSWYSFWNRSQPTTASSSLSMSVRLLLANAIGLPSWTRAASSPIFDASTWIVVSLLTSKYDSARSLQIKALMLSYVACSELFHLNFARALVRAGQGCYEWGHELDDSQELYVRD